MSVRMSSKFKERLLGAESFPTIFSGGRILVYSGAPPASADYPVQGTLLAQVTQLGQAWTPGGSPAGLDFALSGVWAVNDPTQSWQLVASVAGTAGWFRLVGPAADAGDYSFSLPRLDGTVGTGGAVDMKLASVSFTVGYTLPLQQFLFSFPPAIGA